MRTLPLITTKCMVDTGRIISDVSSASLYSGARIVRFLINAWQGFV